jgi:hypothetical protein
MLVADLALVRGVAPARTAAALQRFWDQRGRRGLTFASELARIAGLAPGTLDAIEAEADRLVSGAGGDARTALGRRGLARSIHVALSRVAPSASRALAEAGAGARAPLHTVDPERYVDFLVAGEGGMGVVYMALDTELNRFVAFKMVRPDAGHGRQAAPEDPMRASPPPRDTPATDAFEELKARFLQEAWVTGGLEHPGIVPVYGSDRRRTASRTTRCGSYGGSDRWPRRSRRCGARRSRIGCGCSSRSSRCATPSRTRTRST